MIKEFMDKIDAENLLNKLVDKYKYEVEVLRDGVNLKRKGNIVVTVSRNNGRLYEVSYDSTAGVHKVRY